MAAAAQKIPGPDHPITIQPSPDRVVVKFGGAVIADTNRALTLREASYPPVHYIPRADVRMELLQKTEHHSHCPYKGEAAYFTIAVGDRTAKDAIWTYEKPFDAVHQIAEHLAFYPDRVDSIEIEGAGEIKGASKA
jgi:uncharacterized protein (DUF427 family)